MKLSLPERQLPLQLGVEMIISILTLVLRQKIKSKLRLSDSKPFRSIIDKLEKSNQVISESIALIESKIIEVNQRIDDTVTSNTP